MADDLLDKSVNDAPISPIDRRNSLEKHLQTRPDAQDLKNRNILHDTSAAPSIQAVQRDLERQRASDALRKNLEKRPERDDLVDRNILPDSTAAPALQAQAKELQKHMRRDSLEQKLQSRPKPEELIKDGILTQDENPIAD